MCLIDNVKYFYRFYQYLWDSKDQMIKDLQKNLAFIAKSMLYLYSH